MTLRQRRGHSGAWRGMAALGVIAPAFVFALAGSGHAASSPRVVRLTATRATPAAIRGGVESVGVAVANTTDVATAAGLPTSFTIAIPAGLAWDGATVLRGRGRVRCAAAGATATCSTGSRLPAHAALAVLARFRIAADASGAKALRITGGGTAKGVRTQVVVRPTAGTPAPAAVLEVGGDLGARLERTSVATYDVLNTGSGPAVAAGGLPSIELTGALPDGVLGTWRASGRGWTCTGAGGTAPSCALSTPVAAGTLAPRLTITYRLDAQKIAALDLAPGGKPATQRWQVSVTTHGEAGASAWPTPAELDVLPPPAALIVPTARAAHGLLELLPGAKTSVIVDLKNVGAVATNGLLTLSGVVPAGIAVTGVDSASATWSCAEPGVTFTCRTDRKIAPRGTLRATIRLQVAESAAPGTGEFAVAAAPANSNPAARPRVSALPFEILEGNAGFPSLIVLRAAKNRSLEPVLDGSAAKLLTGQELTERLDVRNAGGADLAAGSTVELTQQLTAGSTIRSIRTPAGWRCSGTTALRCTFVVPQVMAPASIVEGPTVTVAAGVPTKGERAWTATVALDPLGRTKPLRAPVLVSIERGVASLVANLKPLRVPTAGGAGTFALFVRNTGNAPTGGPVTAGVRLPHGAHLTRAAGAGWACSAAPSRTSVRCVSSGPAGAGSHLSRIALAASFGRSTGNRSLGIGVRANASATRAAAGSLDVVPRHALVARIHHHVHEVTDFEPLVRAGEKPVPTVLVLEGDGSGGSGVALHYRWRQRCTTLADARAHGSGCAAVTPAVTWLTSRGEGNAEIAMPKLARPATLVFELTVDDGSAHSSASTRLRVLPVTRSAAGFTFRGAHPRAERPETVSVRKVPLPLAAVKLKDAAKPKAAPASPDTGAAPALTTTVTTATAALVASPPAVFCQLAQRASSSSLTATVAGVPLALENVTRSSATCDTDTVLHFSGSTMSIHGYLHAAGLSGSITPQGINFDGGTMTGPEAWRLPDLAVTRALSIAFSADGAAISGSVSGTGDVPFLPLTSRWHGQTTLSFADGTTGPAVTLAVDAAGPRSESSPASPLPALTIQGPVRDNGTFALALQVERLVQVRGHAVDVSGHVTRETPTGEIAYDAAGDAPASFPVLEGLDVDRLHVTFKPTEKSLGIAGHGELGISGFGGRLKLPFTFTYDDPENYALLTESHGGSSWEAVPGLTVGANDFHGSVVAKADHLALDISADVAHWTPVAGVAVSNLKLAVTGGCPNTAVSCRKNAIAYIDVKGDAAFTLPLGGGTLTSRLEGTIVPDFSASKGAPTKTKPGKEKSMPGIQAIRVVASFPHGIPLGGGVMIDRPALVVQAGVPVPPEEPMPVSDTAQYLVDVTGGVTIPGIGTSPIVHALFTHDGWAIASPIGTFSVPGASGDGTKLEDAVVGWSTFPTTMEILERTTKKTEVVSLPGKVFKLTGDYTTPSWGKRLLQQTFDVRGRATGLINPVTGTYALRMHVALPSQPYIYGDASTSTQVRLTSSFFEITRTDSLFSLAVGGRAKLQVGAGGGLDGSEIDLEAALSLDSEGTIVGKLSFDEAAGWKNAFGVNDLTLHNLALQFALKLKVPVPDLGLKADAVLPSNARGALGMSDFARTLVVAQLSLRNACLGVQVYDPAKSGRNVLTIGNGAITARSFELWFAPRGCTIDKFTYKAGASLKFDGRVGGIPLTLEATVGFKPFTFDGYVDLGETPLGGITVKRTRITAKLAPSLLHVTFAGGITVLGTNVDVSGKVEQRGKNTIFDLTGTLDRLSIGEDMISARDIRVTMFQSSGEQEITSVRASGAVKVLTATVDGTVAFSQTDGKLSGAKADLVAKVSVGGANGLALDGRFKLDYEPGSKTSGSPKLDATVTASVAKTRLSNTSVVIQNGFIQLTSVYTYGSFFTAQIEGAAFYGRVPAGATTLLPNGTAVPARNGDFFLAARNVALRLGPFGATGFVWIGHVQGIVRAEVRAAMQVTGGPANNTAIIEGVLNGNTDDLDLTGKGKLDLIGYTQDVDVLVRKRGNSVAVSGQAAIGVLGSTVSLRGDFSFASGTYRFRLTGDAALNVNGYSLAGTNVKLSNFPDDAGFSADVNVSAGKTATVSGKLSIEASGRFFLRADATVDLGVVKPGASVTFANVQSQCIPKLIKVISWWDFRWALDCKEVGTTPYMEATASANFPTFNNIGFTFTVRLNGNGAFHATVRTPAAGWTIIETSNLGSWPVDGRARLKYYVALSLFSDHAPYFDVSAGGEAEVQYQYWTPISWSSWRTAASVRLELRGLNPFRGCAWVEVIGYDVGGCV